MLNIIIVNYNSGNHLRDCLEAIHRNINGKEDYDITVYDNGSTDHSLETAKDAFADVKYIGNHTNFGFARAANQAISATRGRYILLLNPDVLLFPGTIERMIEFMDKNQKCGILGAEILSPAGFRQPTCRRFPDYFNILFGRRSLIRRIFPRNPFSNSYLYLDMDYNKAEMVDFVEGSVMMLRRSALDEVGLFDEDFFLYVEDADLCYRMQQKGWQVWWLPRTYAIHYRGENFRRDNIHPAIHHSKGFYRFFKKHYAPSGLMHLLLRILLGLRLAYVVSTESVKKILNDINFSPPK
ncbi:MAG TPA: glycosyltransferase family 2 protein [candidate division WOR-3 bacterium]|uniref:Glycosyltransferase family 2 protein n=1 Tax=candidate division WOR-3 bacterium TaxID=2052148 RepID=A0A9C9K0G8_UNCW3|nr:glycosyltransferase family 2 protein [candidate division WOR-3 bacterium]